jgi:hypothetical protein
MPRQVVWTALLLLAAVSGCDGKPDVAITTALSVNAPAGQNEGFLYDLCATTGTYKNAHVQVMYFRPADMKRVFTVVPFCSDILKRYAKYRDPRSSSGTR